MRYFFKNIRQKLWSYRFVVLLVSTLINPTSSFSCMDFKNQTNPQLNKSLPILTYSHTSEYLTSSAKVESVEYWQYTEFKHGQKIINLPQTKLDIFLLCNHTKPVKLLSDRNPTVEDKIQITSYTYRQAKNYSDPSTERFIAVVRLQIEPGYQSPVIYICEDIQDPCNSRITITELDVDTESYIITNHNYSDIDTIPSISNFVMQREQVEALNLANNDTCPMKLTLYHLYDEPGIQGEIYYDWHDHSDTASSMVFPGFSLTRENDYRFVQSLGESCVNISNLPLWDYNMSSLCPSCKSYNFYQEPGYPHISLYNRISDEIQRVFHGYFDLSMQYLRPISEPVDNDELTAINFGENETFESFELSRNVDPPSFYKGETIRFKCVGSAAKFSPGVYVLWGIPGGDKDYEEAIPFNDDGSGVNIRNGGGVLSPISLNIPKELLDAKNISILNITCLFPVWNTTEWIGRSVQVNLTESRSPSATLLHITSPLINSTVNNNSKIDVNSGETVKVTCVVSGDPLPDVKFTLVAQTLNHTVIIESKSKNESMTTLELYNVDHTFNGVYSCSSSNVAGRVELLFEIAVLKETSAFVKTLAILLCLAFLICGSIAFYLIRKYRREQVDFRRKTAEAIRKFHEGFKDTKGIGFTSSNEHKAYELPLAQWDFGGTILGKGAFGTVHKGCIRQGHSVIVVAVKTVNAPKDVLEFESSLKELLIMSYIGKHPHIISLIAACTDKITKRSLILATEYCANGDLLSFITKNKKYFCKEGKISVFPIKNDDESAGYMNIMEEDDKSYSLMDLHVWSMQIADGMAFLESKKVLHGDLAARNVLLTQQKVAKISDFGLSRQLTDDGNYTKQTYCPLPWKWMALESLQYRTFSPRSDVWAYGITLFEIYSLGEEPWSYLEWTTEFVDELEHGRRLTKPRLATDEIYDKIMLECWRNDPEDRVSFEKIKTFYNSIVPQTECTDQIPIRNPGQEEESSGKEP